MVFRSLEGNACRSLLIAHLRRKMQMFTSPCYPETQLIESKEGYERKLMLNHVHHKKNLRNYGCNMPFSRNLQNSHLLPSMLASPNMRNSGLFFSSAHPNKKKTQVGIISKIPSHKVSATWPTPLGYQVTMD